MKATKYNRIYYQLCPLEPYTEEIEFGLLPTEMMLPTPTASDATTGAIIGKNDIFKETSGLPRKINQNGTDGSVGLARLVQLKPNLLPTPTAMDATNATVSMKSSQTKEGSMHSMTLTRMMDKDLLPTPTTMDWKGKQASEYKQDRGEETEFVMESLPGWAEKSTGITSQLNPLFVAEMMGFPIEWLILPFQDGEKKL
jgi:hypothetical protein